MATAPAFAVGERVRAKALSVPGHTRLPGYVPTTS
ncbi:MULTISPECIES: SH3-like domain-containing protein [Streptomyces violaceusniger group]|nr:MULTISPECIES: SH3-like domain-containing protein [Streptomyces violaceusniger group]